MNYLRNALLPQEVGARVALPDAVGAFHRRFVEGRRSEGEGACSSFLYRSSQLPLRGKLGWMTPRFGVKTTLTTKRALRGSRSQAGAPFFTAPLLTFFLKCSKLENTQNSVQRRIRFGVSLFPVPDHSPQRPAVACILLRFFAVFALSFVFSNFGTLPFLMT
jgi:hypothetical protein